MDRRTSGRTAALSLLAVGLLVGAGCSSDGAKLGATNRSTTTAQEPNDSAASTTVPDAKTSSTGRSSVASSTSSSSSTPVPTYLPPKSGPGGTSSPPTGGCQASDTALANALVVYARANQPTVPVKVGGIRHSRSDSAWAQVTVTPANADTLDGFVAIAHCVGSQWRIIDTGTSGVGCSPEVPPAVRSDIGIEC